MLRLFIHRFIGICSLTLFLSPFVLQVASAAPRRGAAGENAWDIAVIDRALALARPDEPFVRFGDVGVKPEVLRIFRARLVAEDEGSRAITPLPDADTPPGTAFKWPGGIVPYQFDPTQVGNGTITLAKMQQFRDAVAEWAAAANVQFSEFTGGTPTNYVTVQEDPSLGGGFSSSVGLAGGEQFVKFGPNAWNRGTICHEVGHALGYWHEQQRDDRNSFVTILTQNIIPGQEGNFAKLPGGTTSIGAYDFYSIMHYSRNALSIDPDNLNTIEPKPAFSQFLNIMGQVYYRTLSKLDRAGMAVVYGNPGLLPSAIVTNTKDSGPGSLRAALYYAFDKSTDVPPVPTAISFQIPTSDPGFASNVFTIRPTYLLVAPGAGTTVDGATQTAFTGDTNTSGPEIVLSGSQLPGQNLFAQGFDLREANCVLKNLVINGFNLQGVLIEGAAATGNLVIGCYIGTNETGTNAVPNTFPGIEIVGGAHGNAIGGTTTAARNIISGNAHLGVSIHDAGSNSNLVQGNFIGTNALGTSALPNAFQGVELFSGAQSNVIGGTIVGARNIISGNNSDGVAFLDPGTSNNLVQGNFIGTNALGTATVPNLGAGVAIVAGAKSNTVGSGTVAGGRNVISGNMFQGVVIVDPGTSLNLIAGNIIGMNAAGTLSLGNRFSGIDIFGAASSNTIGGKKNAASNFISGNGGAGVGISGVGTKSNKVQHNFIGTNAAGTAAIPNAFSGIDVFTAVSNVVGGVGKGNVISGNGNYGVVISGSGASANNLQGNFIGTNAAGTAGIGNAFAGIALFNGAQNNLIGSSVAGAGNVIAFNSFSGIEVFDSTTFGNDFNANSIFSNGALGINLFGGSENGFGVTTNDLNDPDAGPNQLQNFPLLAFVNSSALIQGTLNSVPSKSYRLDFYSSPSGDPSGNGEGQVWIGAINTVTDSNGNATFSMDFPGSLTVGSVVSATATGTGTGASGTSEFSANASVVP